jgi:ribosomal protein L11 methyltransferase
MTVDLIGPSQIIVAADDHGNTDLFLAEVERVISSLPFRAAIEETRFGCLEPTPLNKTVLSRRFSVAHPDLRGGVTGDEEIIYLECGTVFGSGHHPSTRLAVMALEEVFGGNLSSAEVLDVGCGSGILSFICSRLGAKRVLGIDISANAIEIAEKNRAHTCSGEQVRFSCAPVSQVFGVFDLIVANISPSILQVLIDSFAQVLAVHGKVVLAGLHTGQVNGIVRQMMMISCELQKSYGEGSWRALSFQRTGD